MVTVSPTSAEVGEKEVIFGACAQEKVLKRTKKVNILNFIKSILDKFKFVNIYCLI